MTKSPAHAGLFYYPGNSKLKKGKTPAMKARVSFVWGNPGWGEELTNLIFYYQDAKRLWG
jgi:hypothetical protein